MADFNVNKQLASKGGTNVVPGQVTMAAGNNYYLQNDGDTVFIVDGGAASQTLTLTTTGQYDGLTTPNRVVTVGIGARLVLGQYDPLMYNQQSGVNAGRILATCTGTDVKIYALGIT